MPAASAAEFAELRARLDLIGGVVSSTRKILPFGVPDIDAKLPKGGLAIGALHEIAGGANGAVTGTAAVAFAAGIAARTGGQVLWCFTQRDLVFQALAQSGLTEDRIVFFQADDEKALLGAFDEALRHGRLSAVVGELATLTHVASQRLQMAAESTGTMGLVVRRWRRQSDAVDFGRPTAAYTRWRVTEIESTPLPVRGVGRERWQLELMRCRGGMGADFEVEACDAKGFVRIPSELADRSAAPEVGHIRAAS